MKKIKFLIIPLLIFVIVGCSSGGGNVTKNNKPIIENVNLSNANIGQEDTTTLTVQANDKDGDNLTYKYQVDKGSISGEGKEVTYTAPDTQGEFTITVLVSDGTDTVQAEKSLTVATGPYLKLDTRLSKEMITTNEETQINLNVDTNEKVEKITWLNNNNDVVKKDTKSFNIQNKSKGEYTYTAKVKTTKLTERKSVNLLVASKPEIIIDGIDNNTIKADKTATLELNNKPSTLTSVSYTAQEGNIEGNQDTATYTAPSYPAEDKITLDLIYANEYKRSMTLDLSVIKEITASGEIVFDMDFKLNEDNPEYTMIEENGGQTAGLNGYKWYYYAVGMDKVWNYNQTLLDSLDKVQVAVVDSGIDTDHPYLDYNSDLARNFKLNDDFNVNPDDIEDDNGHGTAVAGIISSQEVDKWNIRGFAPNVEIIPIRGMNTSNISYKSFEYAINDLNVDIINYSSILSGSNTGIKDILQTAYNKDIVTVSASGNFGDTEVGFPARLSTTLGVGGVNANQEKMDGSHTGENLDFVAPASMNTLWNGYYSAPEDEWSEEDLFLSGQGTSYATPIISSIVAMMKGKNNSLTFDEIKSKLKKYSFDLGERGKDVKFGYGIPNVYHLLNDIQTSDIQVFLGNKKDTYTVKKLSDFHSVNSDNKNLSAKGNYNFTSIVSTQDYNTYFWVDVNNDNQVNAGDYFGQKDNFKVIEKSVEVK